MSSIGPSTGESGLRAAETAPGFKLRSVFAGTLMELSVENFAGTTAPDAVAQFSANLIVGPNPGMDLVHLCHMTGDRSVMVHQATKPPVLSGFVTDKALGHIAQVRKGHTLNLMLRPARGRMQTDEPPTPMDAEDGDLHIAIPAEIWSAELAKATASAYYDLPVPVTDDPALAKAADHLRAARDSLRNGQNDPKAAIQIRQALDTVCTAYDTTRVAEVARTLNARHRTVQQRWAMSVEDTSALLNTFIHTGQAVVADARARRALASCLLVEVAARVECLAADQRAGLVQAFDAGPRRTARAARRLWRSPG